MTRDDVPFLHALITIAFSVPIHLMFSGDLGLYGLMWGFVIGSILTFTHLMLDRKFNK